MAFVFLLTYSIALFLWIPLLLLAITVRSRKVTSVVAFPIVVGFLAFIYEYYMTYVWEPTVIAPIRVDRLLLWILLVPIEALAVTGLLVMAWARRRDPGVHRRVDSKER